MRLPAAGAIGVAFAALCAIAGDAARDATRAIDRTRRGMSRERMSELAGRGAGCGGKLVPAARLSIDRVTGADLSTRYARSTERVIRISAPAHREHASSRRGFTRRRGELPEARRTALRVEMPRAVHRSSAIHDITIFDGPAEGSLRRAPRLRGPWRSWQATAPPSAPPRETRCAGVRVGDTSIKNGGLKGIRADERDARATTKTLGVRHVESLVAHPKGSAVARASVSSALIPLGPPFLVPAGWIALEGADPSTRYARSG